MDERGYLRITDRIKDMFITGGFNCYPAEIENLIYRHPGIAQVAVIGDPRRAHGRGRHGVRRARARARRSRRPRVIAWCREHMANYKVPRRVEIVSALPMNASGKVLKYELRHAPRAQTETTNVRSGCRASHGAAAAARVARRGPRARSRR